MHGLRRHLLLPRRPRAERTGRLLLVALAADREQGHPDNVTATARLLGTAPNVVRRWRASLLREQLLVAAGGWLQVGPGWASWCTRAEAEAAASGRRWGWDPLPRMLLGHHQPAVLFAAAAVHADAVGPQDARRFIRSDGERAANANTSRATVRTARRLLEDLQLVTIEQVRRGRLQLQRARWRSDSRAGHGAPISRTRAGRMVVAADRGRQAVLATRAGVTCGASRGVTCGASHHQSPKGIDTIRAAEPAASRHGRSLRGGSDGRQAAEGRRAEAERWLGDHAALQRWLLKPGRSPTAACQQLLELAGAFDTAPTTRAKWARRIVLRHAEHAPVLTACLVADVVHAGGRSRARSIGAVVARRLPRLVAGKGHDALSERNQSRTPAQVLGLRALPRDEARSLVPNRRAVAMSGFGTAGEAAPTFEQFLARVLPQVAIR